MDNINDIISSLSSDDIEMLKGVASSILGESQQNNNNKSQPTNNLPNTSNAQNISNLPATLGLNQDDFNMMMKAKTIIDKMNSASSKNADLINALKPHLSEPSRKKADQAIRILKLFEVLPYLKDLF
jgi:hypothetical protein